MSREVTGKENIVWTCIQAYTGLHTDDVNVEAAALDDGSGKVVVVCTPSGGAMSVRLNLPRDWETALSDDNLIALIENHSLG